MNLYPLTSVFSFCLYRSCWLFCCFLFIPGIGMLPLPSICWWLVIVGRFFSKALEGSNIILKYIYFQTWTIPAQPRWALLSPTRPSFPTELVKLISHNSDCWGQHHTTDLSIFFSLACFMSPHSSFALWKQTSNMQSLPLGHGVLACTQYLCLCIRSPRGSNTSLGGRARRSSICAQVCVRVLLAWGFLTAPTGHLLACGTSFSSTVREQLLLILSKNVRTGLCHLSGDIRHSCCLDRLSTCGVAWQVHFCLRLENDTSQDLSLWWIC